MLLKALLLPLSAILAVVSALPTETDAALQAEAEVEARGDLPSTPPQDEYKDEGEIIDITFWAPSNVPSVSSRSDQVLPRQLDLNSLKCGTGFGGDSLQFEAWFNAARDRWICMENGEVKTWVHGNNRFKAANRSGSVRCNKFSAFSVNVWQLGSCRSPQICASSCWARDIVFPGQTFSLWAV
ncbi:hypothetical protein V493_08115 [Pseudogymnoascus sp. VKM F-4281 (FW-2241)]|nr:hypothetical protein V493_08115 [Pseudogymnoascus sp. VKM F-4281 (FW-2241)]